jgi:hypothetical protein
MQLRKSLAAGMLAGLLVCSSSVMSAPDSNQSNNKYSLGREMVEVFSEVNSDDFKLLTATCPEGKVVVGGGIGIVPANDPALQVTNSAVLAGTDNVWIVGAMENRDYPGDWWIAAQAICVNR